MGRPNPAKPGQVYGRLTVTEFDHIKKYRLSTHYYYRCRCECGTTHVASITHLRSGKTRSCGCLNRECKEARAALRRSVHGPRKKIGPRPYVLEGTCETISPPLPFPSRPKERHGYAKTKTYQAWTNAKARCFNPNFIGYCNYGGRGIRVCERWHLFSNFLADMGEAPPGLTLDRINVHGDYEPGNCRWATRLTQTQNRRERIYLPQE